MRRHARVVFLAAVTLGLIPTFVECRDATQMIVEVSTDVPCALFDGATIAVGHLSELDGKSPATAVPSTSCTPSGTIGSLVVVPSGDDDALLAFEVIAGIGVDPTTCTKAGPSCIMARRQLRYIPHETIRIEVPMRQVCAGVSCNPDSTCFRGSCVSATIDPSKCSGGVCDESSLGPADDAGSNPVDAGPTTTGPDSSLADSGPDVVDAGDAAVPIPSIPTTDIQVAMGGSHTCLLAAGQVYCWGANDKGQLGTGVSANPVLEPGAPLPSFAAGKIVELRAYEDNTGARDDLGNLYLWGATSTIFANLDHPTPTLMTGTRSPPISSLQQFCIGQQHVCGLITTASPSHLQCGGRLTGATDYTEPLDIPLPGDAVSVSCGDYNTIVLMKDHTMMSFGDSTESLGRGPFPEDSGVLPFPDAGKMPVTIDGLSGIDVSVTGPRDSFAWRLDGGATFMWGTNTGNQVDNGHFSGDGIPITADPKWRGFDTIVIGAVHACGLRKAAGTVECWGTNHLGQLGLPPNSLERTDSTTSPVSLPLKATALFGGGDHNCARVTDGNLYCWGNNDFGQIGIGTRNPPKPGGTYDDEKMQAVGTPTRLHLP